MKISQLFLSNMYRADTRIFITKIDNFHVQHDLAPKGCSAQSLMKTNKYLKLFLRYRDREYANADTVVTAIVS